MTYSLSITSIIETMRAIAALHILSSPLVGAESLANMFIHPRKELLTSLVKDAFAETLIELLPYVVDSNLDTDESSEFLTFRLDALENLSSGVHTVIRHSIEQSIAHRVLYLCLIALPDECAGMSAEISRKVTSHLDNALTLLRSNRVNRPFIR